MPDSPKSSTPNERSGVSYDIMDPVKILLQNAARETEGNLQYTGFSGVPWTRGESVYLVESRDFYLGHVEEGLGSKSRVADAMAKLLGREYYYKAYKGIGQCAGAMIFNDGTTLGARHITAAMHLAVGSSKWFKILERIEGLTAGWTTAMYCAGCAWAGGETPTLKNIIYRNGSVIGGSAMSIIMPKDKILNPATIQDGDAIVALPSSGIHSNGLTFAQEIAAGHENLTDMGDGQTFGEALLKPTHIYAHLIEDAIDLGLKLRYFIPITGHGWAKIMRAVTPWVYDIYTLPEPQIEFRFMQDRGGLSDRDAYTTFNMGVGGVAIMAQDAVADFIALGARIGWPEGVEQIGTVHQTHRQKEVILPNGVVLTPEDLAIR